MVGQRLLLPVNTYYRNRTFRTGELSHGELSRGKPSYGVTFARDPGNHDPAIAQSAFHRGALGDIEGIHILGVTDEEAVFFPALDLEVWGRAHLDYYDMTPLERPRARTTRWQIATAHGHYEPAPDYGDAPHPSWLISDAEIAATGADYVALGHWNRAQRVGNGEVRADYSGSPDLAGTVNLVRLMGDGGVRVTPHPVG